MTGVRANASKDDTFKDFVLDQLDGIEGLRGRAMFGGFGLYSGEAFFAIVFKGRLYFKTGPGTRDRYIERGMKPFRPTAKQSLTSYYEVPLEIIEDAAHLTAWARAAARG
jgi:DNA transformation protein